MEKGYQSSDLIGKEGIEGTYEDVLRGKDGVKTVQVDSSGNMTKVIGETAPEKGSDVYLTIDLKLQKTLEKALEKGVKCTRYGGTYVDNYGNYGYSRCYPNCKSGAAVAIDVKTGDVLAMASYPSYNPNLFAEGINDKDWAKVQSENARDPLAAAPLYNIAAKCAVQPGSTFKPVTATAALSKGWSPEAYLTDAGAINIGNDKFGCWLYNQYGSTHGSINLRTAIETSCNYYFFDVATGKDWASGGASLGYSLDIDEIMKFAKQYGLGEKTGIEISETVAPTTSAENKLNSMRTQLRYNLEANAEEYFEKSVYNDIGELEGQIDEIVSWIEKNYDRRETIDKLGKLGIKKNKIEKLADLLVYTYFIQSEWNIGDQFNIAIGQGSNAYTPLQMANYLATIGNSGKHNTVSVVESVENQGHTKKEKASSVEISSGNLEAIVDGMTRVCHGSQGSVYDVFKNFDIKCAGKTGTAERSGKINPEDEINYLKKHLGSFSSSLTWKQVEKEIKRLMDKYPDIYTSREDAARRAVMNLAKISSETMDQYKSDYENFAWLICMAPADDPKIAVSVLLVQGGESLYAGPIAREIIGEYLKVKKTYGEDYKIDAGER